MACTSEVSNQNPGQQWLEPQATYISGDPMRAATQLGGGVSPITISQAKLLMFSLNNTIITEWT